MMKSRMRMEIKEVTTEGTFEGLLSPYGNIDDGGDVVEPGAYTKTLKELGGKCPMLWQHKNDEPIGMLNLEDRPDGLWCKGQILLDLPTGQKAYSTIKAGIVRGLSIGFEPIKKVFKDGVRHLTEIKLYEGSIVTFPMNFDALIASVKARSAATAEEKGDFNQELMERQLQDAGYQMLSALSGSLGSLFFSGLSKEETISIAKTSIDQFGEAYMAYLPAYIDMITETYGDMETWAAKQVETKAGATFSASNKKTIQGALDQLMSAHTSLTALITEEAGASTSDEKAAEAKSEPVIDVIEEDHSAALELVGALRALIPAN